MYALWQLKFLKGFNNTIKNGLKCECIFKALHILCQINVTGQTNSVQPVFNLKGVQV